jgi:hydroxyacylglutathione hydrolase
LKPLIRELVVGPLATNCYLVSCPGSDEALIIDPGGDPGMIAGALTGENLTPTGIILTHGHSDHMAAAPELARRFGVGISLHGDDLETLKKSVEDAPMWGLGKVEMPDVDNILSDRDTIEFGGCSLTVRHTPGHTRGGIALITDGTVFVGDTLFAGSIGRTDFFGGDIETLLGSIRSVLFALPDDTMVLPGHGEATDIGTERNHNPFLNGEF